MISPLIGFIFALTAAVALFWGLKIASKSEEGILKYAFYALLIANAISIFFSPRDFSVTGEYFENSIGNNFISTWSIRLTSLLLMLAALERVIYFFRQNQLDLTRLGFLTIILFAWFTNFVIPTYFIGNASPQLTHIYTIAFLAGTILSFQKNPDTLIIHARNALIIFVVLSLLSIAIKPNHVLDLSYAQGYIPGLPRFFGLAPHATMMGLFVALAFWLLITYPLKKVSFQWAMLGLMFIALVMSQSKTVFVTFFIGLAIMYLYSDRPDKTEEDSPILNFKLGFIGISLLSLASIGLILAFVDIETWAYKNLELNQIHNLTTLTGRDVIWAVALEEFYKNPLFGYGPGLFSETYREMIGMPFATHGHNLFIDAMGRAGLVGLTGYILLFLAMGYYSIKFAKQTKGLSLSLFILLSLYSITALPIVWTQLGPQIFTFILLVTVISTQLLEPSDKKNKVS